MSSNRKWMVAVVVALVGVLALYYGVLSGPSEAPAMEGGALADDPTQEPAEKVTMGGEPTRDPALDHTAASNGNAGFLSDSVNNMSAGPPVNQGATQSYNVVGADGSIQPVTIAHDPNASLIRDLAGAAKPVVTPDPGKGDVVQRNAPPIVDPTKTATAPATTSPSTPAAATTTLPPKFESYVIKDGDTMSSIAQSWFGDAKKWDLIAKANPLVDPTKMQVGQKLNLPPKDAKRAQPKLAAGSREYTVRPGDTLITIARALYGDDAQWKKIYEANKSKIGSDPDDLREGIKLTIPQAASRS